MNKELRYYELRAAGEKAAAEAAADDRAKAAHVELARRYDERCAMLARQPDASDLELPTGPHQQLQV